MAQLRDTVVSGSLRATDTLFSTTAQFNILKIPTTSGGTTYSAGIAGQILKTNGSSIYWANDLQGVTSVQVQATSPVVSSTNTAQTSTLNTTISLANAYGDTKNPYGTKTPNYVLAGPSSGTTAAAPSFRALVAADIPILSITDKTSGTLTVTRGGTNLTSTTQGGIVYGSSSNAYAMTSAGTAGQFLKSNNVNAPTWNDITYPDIKPTISKIYSPSGSYGSADSDAKCVFFFMSIKPDSWYKPWQIRFKVRTICDSYANVDSITWTTLNGRADGFIYHNWNERYDIGHYYITMRTLKNAGFNSGLGHMVGVNVRYSTGRGNTAYTRKFYVDYYECENCTITLLDNANLWENLGNTTNYSDINYNGYYNTNAVDRGLRETGDENSTSISTLYEQYGGWTAGNNLKRYQFVFQSAPNSTNLVTLYEVDNKYDVTNKTLLDIDFDPLGRIFFFNTSGTNNTGTNIDPGRLYKSVLADLRYTFNVTSTASSTTFTGVRYTSLFLKTSMVASTGMVHVASNQPLVTSLPTSNDGYYYIYLGQVHDWYRVYLTNYHPVFYHNGTSLVRYYGKEIGGNAATATTLSSTLSVAKGGTGATDAAGARENLSVKALQNNVSSPIASGNSISYIDTISQNTQGVISATKKTIPEVTQSEFGLMIPDDKIKLDNIGTKKQVKTVSIEPVQSGSGDLSPTNVRPISGWTEAKVTRTGKNLFDKSNVTNGGFYADGTVNPNSNDSRVYTDFIRIEPNTTYYISNGIALISGRAGFWYDDNENPISQISFFGSSTYEGAVTSPANAKYARIATEGTRVDTCQFEIGSTATEYEAYDGQSVTIQLGQTVYGGTLDMTTGVLTVDTIAITNYTDIELYWNGNKTTQVDTNRRVTFYRNMNLQYSADAQEKGKCSMLTYNGRILNGEGTINGFAYAANTHCYFCLELSALGLDDATSSTSDSTFVSAFRNLNNFIMTYPLATPVTYQLSPTQILLLEEHKHVWADCGDITLQSCFTNNAANITGIVDISHGGTNATTAADARTNLGLGNVENTALSTWVGTNKITILGTITTGTWQGTAIAASYIGDHSTDKLTSGTLSVARGGTGVTSIENIRAGKDGNGDTISSTYVKLNKSGGQTIAGPITISNGLIVKGGIGLQQHLTYYKTINDVDEEIGRIGFTTGDSPNFTIVLKNISTTDNSLLGTDIYQISPPTTTDGVSRFYDILTSKNYTDYTVTKTGSGASGTWGIIAANVTGTVKVEHGGTGAVTAAAARTNLGITPANIGASIYLTSSDFQTLYDTLKTLELNYPVCIRLNNNAIRALSGRDDISGGYGTVVKTGLENGGAIVLSFDICQIAGNYRYSFVTRITSTELITSTVYRYSGTQLVN